MSLKRENPYSILLLAIPFILGGIILLSQKQAAIIVASPAHHAPGQTIETASVNMLHAAGALGVVIGGLIVGVYFQIRD